MARHLAMRSRSVLATPIRWVKEVLRTMRRSAPVIRLDQHWVQPQLLAVTVHR